MRCTTRSAISTRRSATASTPWSTRPPRRREPQGLCRPSRREAVHKVSVRRHRRQGERERLPRRDSRCGVSRGHERTVLDRLGARPRPCLVQQGGVHPTEVARPRGTDLDWMGVPRGGQRYTAKHVTFGVDPSTLKNHPTVAPAITAFCESLKQVPGGRPATGSLNAFISNQRSSLQRRHRRSSYPELKSAAEAAATVTR